MSGEEPGGTHSEISGGNQFGPVVQGRNISASFHLPTPAPIALQQLPALTASFTGRDAELGVLARLLDPARQAAGTVVVSAVAGLAGIGKTTLAIQAGHAAQHKGWYPGGVLFIDLHGYDDQPVHPAQALDALLRALGVAAEHIPPGTEERAALYRSALAQITGPVLIVADNASSEAQVRLLLPGTGPHQVLITSRHTLAGLGARLIDITTLNNDAAVELLDTALRAARPADNRITSDPAAATRLAQACGGLPLALQITAATLTADPTLTAAELDDELEDEAARLDRLAYDDGTGTTAPSVAAAFELSYRRLDDTSARLFRLLAVSPGPDTSTAAAAVLAGLPATKARTVLAGLARAHLAEPAPGTPGRWRMHDLVRLYAQQLSDQHAHTDNRDHALDQLLDYYTDTAKAADDHLRALTGVAVPDQFGSRQDALAWLDAERAALTAAVALAAGTGRDQVAMRLPILLAEYLDWRRRFDDKLATMAPSLDAARRLGNRPIEASALTSLGIALAGVRRFKDAITVHWEAAAIYRQTGERHGEGTALNNLGTTLTEMRRFGDAITACQDAVAIYRDTGDRHGEGVALNNLGLALHGVRRFEDALTACKDAAAIYRQTGDRPGEGKALMNLGMALHGLRRFEEAIAACKDAAAIYRDTGDRYGEGMVLSNLGLALRNVGRFDEAITACQEAAAIYRDTGDRHREGVALNNLGLALSQTGRFKEAITAHQLDLAICNETGDRHGEGGALANLGLALRNVGRFDEAITACKDAAAIFRETGDQHGGGMALDNLGRSLGEVGRFGEAITAHQDAAAIYRETGDRHREGMALKILGIALAEVGRFEEAITSCQEAAAIYHETGDQDSEHRALQLLKQVKARQRA